MSKENINFYKVVIASYLHDIGKILWRGGFDRIVFNNKSDYTVAHAQHLRDIIVYSNEYYEKNKSLGIKKLDNFSNSTFWKDVAYIGSLHHANDKTKYNEVFEYINNKDEVEFRKKLVSIVYVSDNVASLDRFQEENDIDEKNEKESEKSIKQKGLGSIFENIFNFGDTLTTENIIRPDKLEILNNPEKNIDVDFKDIAREFYNELVNYLSNNIDLENKSEYDMKKSIYDLDMICQRYFSLIPSDSFQGKTRDLSLYDHTKIVAAVSSVLYEKFINREKTNLTITTDEVLDKDISLIAGDFPSIQKYIFSGIKKQKQIAKRLRARSFRVQMLNEAVIEYLLEKLGYSRANVIINAGGKFVIIADKISDEEIIELKSNINSELIKKFNSEIKFSLIQQQLKVGNVFANNNGKIYDLEDVKQTFVELFDELSKDKFKIYDKNNLKNIFTNKSISGNKMCKYCGQNYLKSLEENEDIKCDNCKKEVTIGENIVKNNNIFIDYIDKNGDFEYNEDFKKGKLNILFNNWDYNELGKSIGIGKSINLHVPKNHNGDTKDFENIILDDKKNGKVNGGLDYICMLKGDIDSMSLIFKHGFDFGNINNIDRKTLYSVNRLTQFSRFLELFFGTYLDNKIKENFENVYTVFSGGDDFIFIVPFLQRQKFINFLYKEFSEFIGNNKIHFSIGLGVFKDKTPFKTMDTITEELLKDAKSISKERNRNENDINNKLTFKGITVYEKNYTNVLKINEIDLIDGVSKWDENIKIDVKIEDYYKKEGIEIENNISFSVGDTQIYTIYSELSKFRDIYSKESIDFSEAILIGARILNMLARNKTKKENEGFKNLKKDIEELIGKIYIGDNEKNQKIEKINQILLGLIDNIYKNRYKNNT